MQRFAQPVAVSHGSGGGASASLSQAASAPDLAVIDGAALGGGGGGGTLRRATLALVHLVFACLGAVSLKDEHGSIRAAALEAGADQHHRRLLHPGRGYRTAAMAGRH